jgi:hypothetical protein
VPGARVLYTMGRALARSRVCMRGAASPNCHKLLLSLGTSGNAPTVSMHARRHHLHCILLCHSRDLEMLANLFGLCRWSTNFGRLLVVYYRNKNFTLKFGVAHVLHCPPPPHANSFVIRTAVIKNTHLSPGHCHSDRVKVNLS